MGKGHLNLYIDADLLERAKLNNINLSDLFTNILRTHLDTNIELENTKEQELDNTIIQTEKDILDYKTKLIMLKTKQKEIQDKRSKELKELSEWTKIK